MKLVKYLVTTAAITAVTAAMAVSASAAISFEDADGNAYKNDFTVSVNEESKKVSLSGIGTINGDQMTMLILNNDATTVTEGDIEQIDQVATATSWADIAMSELTVGQTYYVRIGGDGTIKTATFTVKEDGGVEYLLGDIDLSGYIDSDDALEILKYDAGYSSCIDDIEDEDTINAMGDVDSTGYVDSDDALEILKYDAGYDSIIDWE